MSLITNSIQILEDVKNTYIKQKKGLAVEIMLFLIHEYHSDANVNKGFCDIQVFLNSLLDDIERNPISVMLVTSKDTEDFYIKNFKYIGEVLNDMQEETGQVLLIDKPLDYHNTLINKAITWEARNIRFHLEELEILEAE